MKKIVRHLLPFALITLVLFALALSPFAPLAGAQDGQKLSAAASGASSAKTNAASSDPKPSYPVTKRIEHVDNYHGTIVADPTAGWRRTTHREGAWVGQNKVTFAYLKRFRFGQLAARVGEALQLR